MLYIQTTLQLNVLLIKWDVSVMIAYVTINSRTLASNHRCWVHRYGVECWLRVLEAPGSISNQVRVIPKTIKKVPVYM